MASATLPATETPKKYINLSDDCEHCSNIGTARYNINIYDLELALLQRELELMRDLLATKDELIVELKSKLND